MQPHTSYLVCGTPRSGSSLLCEALTNTGEAGRPEEYFQPANEIIWQERWGTSTYEEYLAHTIEQCTTPNGVFGVKMMWGYFDHFLHRLYQMPDYKKRKMPVDALLQAAFPNLHYVWIRRRDIVRQAVSQAKAMQTNQWVVRGEASRPAAYRPAFSFVQIDFLVQEIQAHNAAWRRFFSEHHIQPLMIVYEDLAARYEETVKAALQHLEVPDAEALEIAPVSMKKQADGQSEQWVQRYLRLRSQVRYRLVSQANGYLLSFLHTIRPGASITVRRAR